VHSVTLAEDGERDARNNSAVPVRKPLTDSTEVFLCPFRVLHI